MGLNALFFETDTQKMWSANALHAQETDQ